MSFEEHMNEVDEPDFHVGQIVLGKVLRVDQDEGIYVRFGGPGDGFVPVNELAMSDNADCWFEYGSSDATYWLEIVDLDNTERPILLSETKALRTIEGDGIDTRGIRSEYSHYNSGGSAKQQFKNRERALERINEIRSVDSTARLAPYICRSCNYWHVGNDH